MIKKPIQNKRTIPLIGNRSLHDSSRKRLLRKREIHQCNQMGNKNNTTYYYRCYRAY